MDGALMVTLQFLFLEVAMTEKPISRARAVSEVINAIDLGDNMTLEELLVEVEQTIQDSGGEENLKASMRVLNRTLKSAEELGLVALHKTITVERVK